MNDEDGDGGVLARGGRLDKEGEAFSHKEREEKGRGLKLP